MKHKWLLSESEKWVNEGIIRPEQRHAIMNRYQQQDRLPLIFFLSALFIGLACLSLVAANWQAIPELIRMLVIILFLVIFYTLGHVFEQKGKFYYGLFCYIVALMVFGAGIFLTGQMYHYTMNNVFAFIVWGLAAFLLYLSRPYILIYITGLAIVSVGTIYGLSNMHSFDWWLFALFVIAYGSVVWSQKRFVISYIFSIAYLIQLLGFTLDQLTEFYWYGIFILLLHVFGLLIKTHQISKPFQRVSLLAMFITVLFQTMLMELSFYSEYSIVYYLILLLLMMAGLVISYRRYDILKSLQLVIFLPVIALDEGAQLGAYIVLFIFSITILLDGYQKFDDRKFHMGTATFLITTILVYMQVAWGFLNQSLFFFIGGVILLIIGFLLEKKRKDMSSQKQEGGV